MIQKQFEKYLESLKINSKSLKNYRSDVNYFLKFTKFDDLEACIPYLSSEFALNYKENMVKTGISPKVINRRLSTLRKLARFLYSIEAVDCDFAEKITNVGVNQENTRNKKTDYDQILDQYKKYLIDLKVSRNTIKNYLSDTRHFLLWLKK